MMWKEDLLHFLKFGLIIYTFGNVIAVHDIQSFILLLITGVLLLED